AAAISRTPSSAVPVTTTTSQGAPRRINAGLRTKKNGTKYMTDPIRIASKPMAKGLQRASGAAANEASATGGVMKDTMPQYMMKGCTAKGSSPAFTSGGASTIARKI